jgi:hypothetical protein
MAQIVLAQTDSPTAPSAGQTALSAPATALNQFKWVDGDGGTNIIDGGGFTLTIPATGTAALLGTANVFTAAQRVNNSLHIRGTTDALLRIGSAVTGEVYISAANDAENAYSLIDIRASVTRVMAGHLLIGTTTDSAQLTVLAGSTSTVGLVVDTPASTTSESISLRYNGSERVRFLNWATLNAIYLTSFDNGTGAGSFFYAQKNSNGSTPAAGFVYLDGLSNSYSIWPDTSGNLRILAGSFPINASDTAGTVIGTQTSTLASKILLGGDLTPGEALRTILQTPVKHFKYKSGAYNHSEFQGIVADYSPEFAMDEGRVFNPVSAFGYMIQAVKALTERIQQLEAA